MDSDEDTSYVDSGNESSSDDIGYVMEVENQNPKDRQNDVEEFVFEVLSTEEIVQHMIDCIKEVNNVVEVCTYLLHHLSVRQ